MATTTVSRRDVTAFDYRSLVLNDQVDVSGTTSTTYTTRKDGGDVVPLLAAATLPAWGDVVGISTTTDDSVSKQPTSSAGLVIGVCVGWIPRGRSVFGPQCFNTEFGTLAVGSRIWVQVSGIAYVTTDGTATVSRGALLIPSSTTAGTVLASASPTNGQIVGKALQSATAAATVIRILLLQG